MTVLAHGASRVDIEFAYAIDGWRPTRATFDARLEGLAKGWWTYGDGAAVAHTSWPSATRFQFDEPIGRQRVVAYPNSDVVTAAAHLPVGRATSSITSSSYINRFAAPLLPQLMRVSGALLRTPLRGAAAGALAVISRPYSRQRNDAVDNTSFVMAARVRTDDGAQRYGEVVGTGIYDVTAPLAAMAAHRLLTGTHGTGVLAPAEVLDLDEVVTQLRDYGTRFTLPALGEGRSDATNS